VEEYDGKPGLGPDDFYVRSRYCIKTVITSPSFSFLFFYLEIDQSSNSGVGEIL
jgi:hypothetical protein